MCHGISAMYHGISAMYHGTLSYGTPLCGWISRPGNDTTVHVVTFLQASSLQKYQKMICFLSTTYRVICLVWLFHQYHIQSDVSSLFKSSTTHYSVMLSAMKMTPPQDHDIGKQIRSSQKMNVTSWKTLIRRKEIQLLRSLTPCVYNCSVIVVL